MGNFWSSLVEYFTGRSLDMVIVGLEGSGKTTLAQQLSGEYTGETLPTVGLSVSIIKKDNVKMKCFDLGGQEKFRSEWPKYTANADCILFVLDGHDVKKIPTAKKELFKLLEDKNLENIPLLVCVNKIDLDPKFTSAEIKSHMNLDLITDRSWMVIPISAAYGTNIGKVVEWLIANSR